MMNAWLSKTFYQKFAVRLKQTGLYYLIFICMLTFFPIFIDDFKYHDRSLPKTHHSQCAVFLILELS